MAIGRRRDRVHGDVARARVALELLEQAAAAAHRHRQQHDVRRQLVRERQADVAARREHRAEAVRARLLERARGELGVVVDDERDAIAVHQQRAVVGRQVGQRLDVVDRRLRRPARA